MCNTVIKKKTSSKFEGRSSLKDTPQTSIKIDMFENVWMDNGIENLYRILTELESCEVKLSENILVVNIIDIERFLKELKRAILYKRDNLIVNEKDKKTGMSKEVKKDFMLIQEERKEKKIGGKVVLKEDIYKPEKTYEVLSQIFSQTQNIGDKICILCGKRYSKSIKKLQQASYPFVTKIASLSGVRSYRDKGGLALREYYDNFCPICYLIGILEWTDEAIIYRTFPGEKSLIYLPYFRNLRELNEFKQGYIDSGILNNEKRYSNIKVNPKALNRNASDVEYTPGKFSTLLCFYEKFVNVTAEKILARNWAILNIPFGAMKNIKVDYISIDEGILNIIVTLKTGKVKRIYSDLIKGVRFFSKNKNSIDWEITGEVWEMLSRYFLRDNFRKFTSTLLPRKNGYIYFSSSEVREYLNELIYIWRWKKMGVGREKLDAIKSVGNILAKVSENNASLLYKADKARTINEFWSVLREIARKLPGLDNEKLMKIRPTALDEVIQLVKEITEKDKESWKEVRDLLVVYACMYYSLDKLDKNLKEKGGE